MGRACRANPVGHVAEGPFPYSGAMLDELRSGVLDVAGGWSCPLTKEAVDRVLLYFRRLLEWNVRVNLTGARSMTDLIGDHLSDSFAISRFAPPNSDVLDVGSGGGLPVIPFSIIRPDCMVTLLEPRAKRVAFLNTAVRECGCSKATVVRSRIEDFGASRFSVATSRATFRPEEWFEKASCVLAPGGRVVLLSTETVYPGGGDKQLIDCAEYRTTSGATRWAGCFCSTWNTPEPG
jgi:16S rRNA (guanine527-N7)-methyltransferase